ncbi:MAG: GntP family permease [Rhodospirillales bacterium]
MLLMILLVVAILFIIVTTAKFELHPFLALLITAFGFGIAAGMPLQDVVKAVNDGFGGTIGYIGIVILAGSIIGTFLEKTGGAMTLAERTLRLTGEKNVPAAMSLVGYIVSIPVFCDSGFVLLSPLNKALARKAGITLASSAIALSLGLYATHTMVPPTPGPVAAAGILKADLGLVIFWGMVVAFFALIAGWLFAVLVASRTFISPDAEGDAVTTAASPPSFPSQPGFTKSVLPIVTPILLIVLRSVAELPTKPLGEGAIITFISFLGQPVVALLIGVALAMLLPKRLDKQMISSTGWVGEAVVAAATIIIITGAGGAFGKILQNSGIAKVIGDSLAGVPLGIWLPFIVAAGIKTAQGSSTVSLITTASLMAPLLPSLGLESETAKALAVVAIGAGAMVVSHANDSYFWVVTRFSNMDVPTGYRLHTVGTFLEGMAAAVTLWILSQVLL